MRALMAFLFAVAAIAAAEEAPSWVREANQQKLPTYSPKVNAVILLQEEHVTVEPDGRRIMRERGAVKVLQKGAALGAYRSYNAKAGRIRDFRAWLIAPDGKTTPFGKDRVVDMALDRDSTYDESRMKKIECGGDAVVGAVFAYEVTEEEKTVFTQYGYSFQSMTPVLTSRFTLSLPEGWEVNGLTLNHAPINPAISGNTRTWELRDLPWIDDEDYRPSIWSLTPYLAISYFPGGGNSGLRPLNNWAAVSGWMSELMDPPAEVTAALSAKANALTAGTRTELDKIHAIATFVQQVNYVSVQMNLTRGGGYTPHRADQILAKNYGDCKDKATLMRALLKAAGIDSYVVAVASGDRDHVRPEWPSSLQFNHAIVAVRVSPETDLPTVLTDSTLGRLLIFDPTASTTPLGDLPEYEQGSHALMVAGHKGQLLKLPLLPLEANLVESQVAGKLEAFGSLEASISRTYHGQSAAPIRAMIRQGNDALQKSFERGLANRLGGVAVHKVAESDQFARGSLNVQVGFAARNFAQIMQGRLLIVTPGSVLPTAAYALTAKERKLPVKLSSAVRKESVVIKLPGGFALDEIPEPVHLKSPYGEYAAKWTVNDGELRFEHSVALNDVTAPATEYAALREFFEKMAGGQHAPVVLIRK